MKELVKKSGSCLSRSLSALLPPWPGPTSIPIPTMTSYTGNWRRESIFIFWSMMFFWFCFSAPSALKSFTAWPPAAISIRSRTPSAICWARLAAFFCRSPFSFHLTLFRFAGLSQRLGDSDGDRRGHIASFCTNDFRQKASGIHFSAVACHCRRRCRAGHYRPFYPDPELPVNPRWLSLVFVAVAVAWILNKHKVRSYWAYLLTGILSWAGLHEANMHPSLALIFIIPFIPHETEPGKERCQTELDRFESDFKPIVDYGLFSSASATPASSFPAFRN